VKLKLKVLKFKKTISLATAIVIFFVSCSIFSLIYTGSIISDETTETDDFKNDLRSSAVIRFFDDFESGLSKWQSITGLWHLTDTGSAWPDPCHTPTHAMWFGNESTGNFNTGFQENGTLISIPFSLVGLDAATLKFYHWREGEGGGYYDISFVYISIDGSNWDLLYENITNYIPPWEHVSLDISGYGGNSSVQLKFYFDTLDEVANAYRGWLVDDIHVIGYPSDVDIQIFDSMFINYTFTFFDTVSPSHFNYSFVSGDIFHLEWVMPSQTMFWDVDVKTRIMQGSSGGLAFGDGFHTPIWIYTDLSIGDQTVIAVDAAGDHLFEVTSDLIYDLPGFGPVDVWVLEDLTLPGGIARYEKSTGILLDGIFFFDNYGPLLNYTFEFVDTNVEFTYVPPGPLTLSSDAGIPDDDGSFNLSWTAADAALTYSVYEYSDFINQINGSLTLLASGITDLTVPLSDYSGGIYYFVVVAQNDYGDTLSNCIKVEVAGGGTSGEIPSYNLYIATGLLCIVSVILFKKRFKSIK